MMDRVVVVGNKIGSNRMKVVFGKWGCRVEQRRKLAVVVVD